MRRNRALAEDFAARHGVPAAYDDADALVADPNVDAVYIATPPGSHLEMALKVAAAGKPAYVEKPMARNHAECLRMIEAFERARRPLFVAYYRRALPRFVKAKQIIDAGMLGAIRSIDVRYVSDAHVRADAANLPWRLRAEQSGGGLFLDLASHTLDVLDFFFGPLRDVSGDATKGGSPGDVEDRVSLAFTTEWGARGRGEWNFTNAAREDSITIEGASGVLRLSTFGDTPLALDCEQVRERYDLPNPPHIQQPLIATIVGELLGHGKCPSTGVTAARTSDVMDRALLSYYGSRADGFWNTPQSWPGRRAK
jgi:predicted dehydrogenase